MIKKEETLGDHPLHLYCDFEGCTWMISVNASTRDDQLLAYAKDFGWIISENKHICPNHNKKEK